MNRSWMLPSATCLAMTLLLANPSAGIAAPDITGKYKLADAGKFTMEIVKLQKSYKVTVFEKGKAIHTGVGTLDGDAFAFSWKDTTGGSTDHGVYLFRIKDNGDKFVGKWVNVKGEGEAETWIKVK